MDSLKRLFWRLTDKFFPEDDFVGSAQSIVIVLVVILLLFAVSKASAKPIASITEDGVTITLYDEKCKVSGKVTNLPYRATWEDKKGKSEACVGATAGGQILVFFFEVDNTVVVLPAGAFQPVKNV